MSEPERIGQSQRAIPPKSPKLTATVLIWDMEIVFVVQLYHANLDFITV